HVLELLEYLLDALFGQRVLVAGLRGGQDEQVLAVPVLDECLIELGLAIDDVDQVVYDATLAAHDQVEVAQADVEVDDGGLEAPQREAGGEGGTGGGLAHTTLAGGYDDDSSHVDSFQMSGCISRAAAVRWSKS